MALKTSGRLSATMSTTATTELPPDVLQPRELPPVRPSGRFGDVVFANLTRLAAVVTLSLLIAIIVSLVIGAWPSIREFGLPFLWTAEWDPVQNKFGGLVMIYGTIATSIIALIIAVPVSFGIALFLTELSPRWLKRPLGTAIELLAAIPSIVYGMWGLLVFAPLLAEYVQQPLQARIRRDSGARRPVFGRTGGNRHPVGRHHSGDHDHSVHRGRDA